ncbi:MAG: hypothetical protein ACOX4O_12885 [Eubacteriales bacterium]|jgi:hypothetical protein
MKLYRYELFKLVKSKFTFGVLLALWVFCGILGLWSINQSSKQPSSELLNKVYAEYYTDPKAFDSAYSEWIKLYDAYNAKFIEYSKYGGEEPIPPADIYGSDGSGNKLVYDKLYSDVFRENEYHETIAKVVRNARSTILSMEDSGSTDTYTYRYQQQIADIYTGLYKSVYVGFENTRGWDRYFSGSFPFYITLLVCAAAASFFYTTERQTGCYPIIRTGKLGRFRTCIAKIFAAVTVTSLFFLAAQFTWLAAVGYKSGFGSLYNGIQAYSDFTHCPFNITVGQYFIADLALKWIILTAFTSVCTLISSISDYISSCAFGAILLMGSIGVYFLSKSSFDSVWHKLNPIFIGLDSMLRYYSLNIAGQSVSLWFIAVPLYLLIAIVCFTLSIRAYLSITEFVFTLELKLPSLNKKSAETNKSDVFRQTQVPSLFGSEFLKLAGSKAALIFMAFYIIAVTVILSNSLGVMSTDNEKLRDYIESGLFGEVSDEKFAAVAAEGERLIIAQERYDANVHPYYRGEISLETFKPIADEKTYSDSRSEAYLKLSLYSAYLESQEHDVKPWFVFEEGFKRLFSDSGDYLLILLCCFIGSVVVGAEYRSYGGSGGFFPILSVSRKGRRPVYFAKFNCCILISAGMCLFTYIVRVSVFLKTYGLSGFGAPLYSLQTFEGHPLSGLSIGAYMILHLLYTVLSTAALCIFSAALTMITKKAVTAFICSAAIWTLPVLINIAGIKMPDFLSAYRLSNLTNINCPADAAGVVVLTGVYIAAYIGAYRAFTSYRLRKSK